MDRRCAASYRCCHAPAAGLGEAVRDKAREEVRLLQRHSGSTAAPEAWDEQYLRAKAEAAQVMHPPFHVLVGNAEHAMVDRLPLHPQAAVSAQKWPVSMGAAAVFTGFGCRFCCRV